MPESEREKSQRAPDFSRHSKRNIDQIATADLLSKDPTAQYGNDVCAIQTCPMLQRIEVAGAGGNHVFITLRVSGFASSGSCAQAVFRLSVLMTGSGIIVRI